jgi:lipoprotein-anchoring transpeptidase ErfK/SrfK
MSRLSPFTALLPAALMAIGGIATAGISAAQEPGTPAPGVGTSDLSGRPVPGPSKARGTHTALVLTSTAVRRRPAGKAVIWRAKGETRWSGSVQRLMVLGSREAGGRTWLKVRLPIRPNGSAGWMPRNRVRLALSRRFITIDLSRRLLRVYKRGRVLKRFKVVVGAPSTPTPRGLFAIYDRVRQPDPKGFTGPWVLPITAHSEKLRKFDGGPGVVGLHGRGPASLGDPLGSARSHGCIRMDNSRIRYLSRLMVGTAVHIRR